MTTTPSTLTVRTADDLLAMVHVALGFVPEQSVAMVTVGSDRSFHARADLPESLRSDADLHLLVDQLLAPARQHRVQRVFFVLYTADPRLGAVAARALVRAFEGCGIDVIGTLRSDGRRWYPALGRRSGVPEWGVPYDVSAHPFVVQAVLDGQVVHASREELRRTVAADSRSVARVVAALAARAGSPDEVDAHWVRGLVDRHVGAGSSPTDADVAVLLRGLLDPVVRDASWAGLTRGGAAGHVAFWTDVVRRAPAPLIAGAASVLALACWCAGDGALAWCALDRAAESAVPCTLADLVSTILAQAVSPDVWRDVWPEVGPEVWPEVGPEVLPDSWPAAPRQDDA